MNNTIAFIKQTRKQHQQNLLEFLSEAEIQSKLLTESVKTKISKNVLAEALNDLNEIGYLSLLLEFLSQEDAADAKTLVKSFQQLVHFFGRESTVGQYIISNFSPESLQDALEALKLADEHEKTLSGSVSKYSGKNAYQQKSSGPAPRVGFSGLTESYVRQLKGIKDPAQMTSFRENVVQELTRKIEMAIKFLHALNALFVEKGADLVQSSGKKSGFFSRVAGKDVAGIIKSAMKTVPGFPSEILARELSSKGPEFIQKASEQVESTIHGAEKIERLVTKLVSVPKQSLGKQILGFFGAGAEQGGTGTRPATLRR